MRDTNDLPDTLKERLRIVEESLSDIALLIGETGLVLFRSKAQELTHRLSECKGPLHLGILGGTGTGKSTLINAIAGMQISGTSDRRPHTDKAVVYCHSDKVQEAFTDEEFIQLPCHTHESELLRDLIIYDMPDFDSIRAEHHARVLAFLHTLDIVLWVVSPEKYADQAFYEMLESSPHADSNFAFVMNKIDLVVDRDSEKSVHLIGRLMGDFALRLRNHGLNNPRVFALSAEWAAERREGADNAGYQQLLEYLTRERKEKEVRAIKLGNLEHEFRTMVSQVGSQLDFDRFAHSLGKLRLELEEEWKSIENKAMEAGREALIRPGTGWIQELYLAREEEPGPILAMMKLRLALRRFFNGEKRREGELPVFSIQEATFRELMDKVSFLWHRVVGEMTAFGIPLPLHAPDVIDGTDTKGWKILQLDAGGEIGAIVSTLSFQFRRPSISLNRINHAVLLAIPPTLLVLYLLDFALVEGFMRSWELIYIPRIFFRFLFTLFTPSGLTGLCSMLVLEVILVPWLAGKVLTRMERKAIKLREMLAAQYGKKVLERLQTEKTSLTSYLDNLRHALTRLEAIKQWQVP